MVQSSPMKTILLAFTAFFALTFSLPVMADHEEHPKQTRFDPQECIQAARIVGRVVADQNFAKAYFNAMKTEMLQSDYNALWARFWPKVMKAEPKPSAEEVARWFGAECMGNHGNPTTMFMGKEPKLVPMSTI